MRYHAQVDRVPTCRFVLVLLIVAAGSQPSAAAEGNQRAREVGRLRTPQFDEVSGMVASRQNGDILWIHNDGDAARVYAVRPSGRVVARVHFFAEVRDLEDIAIGPGPKDGVDHLYLGDIGDNDEVRPAIGVFRFAEPILRPDARGDITASGVEEFRLTYPDRPHNAEALMIDPVTGDLFIATKEKKRARLYAARAGSLKDRSSVVLETVAELDVEYVTGGDISPDASRVILRRESRAWLWSRRERESIAAALERAGRGIPVRCKGQGLNGESIAFRPDGRGYFTVSEGSNQPICFFPLAGAAGEPLR